MPITKAKMAARIATADFQYPDEDGMQDVHIVFRPERVTSAHLDGLAAVMELAEGDDGKQQALAAAAATKTMASILTELLTGWDVLGDDGKPLPITMAEVSALPLDFLLRCGLEVMQQFRLGGLTPTPVSDAG